MPVIHTWSMHPQLNITLWLPISSELSASAVAEKRCTVKSDRYNHSILDVKVTD